jgi:hypothetical protein
MTSYPPAWARSLHGLIVPFRHRDGIAGDLLEEYHDVRVPAHGRRGADAWYIGQVVWCLWCAARWWGVALGALIVVRDALDIYLPTPDYYIGSVWTTYGAMCIFAACGVRAGWYYGCALSGTVIGLAAAVTASVIGVAAPLVFPGALLEGCGDSYQRLSEALDVPAPILLVFGAVLGTIGGAIGRALGRSTLRSPAS